ncbi:hypothetical protein D3C78_1512140 [compost metagenome]
MLEVLTPSFMLPESSTEIMTFGATKADLDVGIGGSCTRSSAQAGVSAVPTAMASRFFWKGWFLVRGMECSSRGVCKKEVKGLEVRVRAGLQSLVRWRA